MASTFGEELVVIAANNSMILHRWEIRLRSALLSTAVDDEDECTSLIWCLG
jgi:hypothetical protein